MISRPILAMLILIGCQGCATQNPPWLEQPQAGLCLNEVNAQCLTDLGLRILPQEILEGTEVDASIPKLAFALSLHSAIPKDFVSKEPAITAYIEAGGVIAQLPRIGFGETLIRASDIQNVSAKSYALQQLVIIGGSEASDDDLNLLLNELFSTDKAGYLTALSYKLPLLLALGDLERAASLRKLLLSENAKADRPFSMLAFVSSAYSASDLNQDATNIVNDRARQGATITDDDLWLIKIAAEAALGEIPTTGEFYYFSSDQTRIDAYLTIGTFSRYAGDPDKTLAVLQEGLRFIQKSTNKADTISAMAAFLILAFNLVE